MRQRLSVEGFTLLEVLISLTLLAVVTLGIVAALLSSMALQTQSREMALAMNTARIHLASLEMYSSLNGLAAAWQQYTSGTDQTFDIPPLTAAPGNPSNKVGWFDFPENPDNTLNENELIKWGMFQDLDGNTGSVSSNVPATGLVWLPLCVTVKWKGRLGVKEWKLYTSLAKKP